jgi:hypothetical protein
MKAARMNRLLRAGFGPVVILFMLALTAGAAEQATTNSGPVIYRLNQVEEARQRASAEGRPIAWIGGVTEHLAPHANLKGKGSHAATAYAIRALQNDTVLCFSDGRTENHTEPAIVDQALHSPHSKYTMPYVIILTPQLDKVICKIPYTESAEARIGYYTAALKLIRERSWQEPKATNAPAAPEKEKPAKEPAAKP